MFILGGEADFFGRGATEICFVGTGKVGGVDETGCRRDVGDGQPLLKELGYLLVVCAELPGQPAPSQRPQIREEEDQKALLPIPGFAGIWNLIAVDSLAGSNHRVKAVR